MKHRLPNHYRNNRIRIVVAGAGGSGSQVITGLARMHVALNALGHPGFSVHVFDPDTVTDANVGRQLFSPSDVGTYKSDVLVNRINCFFGLDWEASPTKYGQGLGQCDILIGCVDSAAARRKLAGTYFDYWLDLGNQARKGQVILGQSQRARDHDEEEDDPDAGTENETGRKIKIRPGRLLTVLELFPELQASFKEDNAPSCSLAEALGRQDLFINQTIATFALQLLWQFIRQGGLDVHGYFVNLETGNVRPLPIDYDRKVVLHKKVKVKPSRKPQRKGARK